jgi:DtxR family Mn-dependent transcriptional regulator
MIQKLSEKKLVSYVKYKGASLTKKGESIAIQIIRKHRLWETFLVTKLNFGWEEVHEIAEQLEHIDSVKLIDSLDHFLKYPKFDPHGDPIPDKKGRITYQESAIRLSEAPVGVNVQVVSVNDDSLSLLKFLEQQQIILNSRFLIVDKYDFDKSIRIKSEDGRDINLSKKVIDRISVKQLISARK